MNDKAVDSSAYSADYYAESCGGGEFFRAYGAEIVKPQLQQALRRAELRAGMRVLDIGCGRGELLHQARRAGAAGVGTDYAAAALTLAEEISGCPVVRCDAKALPFAGASFDRVFVIGVIDHLHDWELETAFAEIRRVLAPGGRVLVHTCANRRYFKNLSYGLRAGAARLLGRPAPQAPRTGEDEALHVNEHSYGEMRGFFGRRGWRVALEAIPNYKCLVDELYGVERPADFPLRQAPPLKAALSRLAMRLPLARGLLAREFFAVLTPADD